MIAFENFAYNYGGGELLSEVYLWMTRGQDSLLMDAGLAENDNSASGMRMAFERKPLAVLPPSAEELAEHQAYLDLLDKSVKGSCLWRSIENPPPAEPAA